MKKLISLLCALSLLSASVFCVSAVQESSYDPFGTSALGPNAPEVSAVYYSSTGIYSTHMRPDVFEIWLNVKFSVVPLYVSFPKLGGIRIYSTNQGEYKPTELKQINYSHDASGWLLMETSDGASAHFRKSGSTFELKIVNQQGKCLLDINPGQIKFGYTGSELKKIYLEMPLLSDEIIYGTGERFSGLNQVSRRTMMWNVDCGYHGNSENAELWRGYKNVPILHSTRGYTLFYNSFYSATVDIGYTDTSKYSMDFAGPELDFYLWTGEPLENIEKYTDLTGKSILPPKWSLRYLSGCGKQYWNSASSYASALTDVMEGYKNLGTPDISAIYLEGEISDSSDVYNIASSYGTRVLKWNSPDLPRSTMEELLNEYSSSEMPIVQRLDGNGDSGSFIDFSHKNANELMLRWTKPYIDMGLCGGLIDFGELIQPTTLFANGKSGYSMHNYFSYLYAKGYFDAYNSQKKDGWIFFARAACAGAQKYTACFSGDQAATFYGLKQQLSGGLSLSTSGFSIWGGDLAGYEGMPTNEVYCRGMELSTFYPVMRAHGTATRFPWDFGEDGKATYKKCYWLRENLLDKLYSSALESHETGLPMMRAFALEFPDQADIADIDDEYIFCNDFLVAPVLESGAVQREVVFPSGSDWYSIFDGTVTKGGISKSVDAPITTIPVYLRSGAVVPVSVSESLRLTESMSDGNKTSALLITPPVESHEIVHRIDEQTSVKYRNMPSDSGYSITAQTGNTATAVIAYGTPAKGVSVDGMALEKLSECPSASSKPGYYLTDDGKTVVNIGSSDWSNITFLTENSDIGENKIIWNFDSNTELEDFNAYISDSVCGYEEQNTEKRWTFNSDGTVMADGKISSGTGVGTPHYWSGLSRNTVSLSPKGAKFRNFETEITFKSARGAGATGAVMVGMRETLPGKHNNGTDSWNLGIQDATGENCSVIAGVVSNNQFYSYDSGALKKSIIPGVDFLNDDKYYTLKIRVVENNCTQTLYDSCGSILFTQNVVISDKPPKSGAISFYVNGDCKIDAVSLSRLDAFGQQIPIYPYESAYSGNEKIEAKTAFIQDFDGTVTRDGVAGTVLLDSGMTGCSAFEFAANCLQGENGNLLFSYGDYTLSVSSDSILCIKDKDGFTVSESRLENFDKSKNHNYNIKVDAGTLIVSIDGVQKLKCGSGSEYYDSVKFGTSSAGTAFNFVSVKNNSFKNYNLGFSNDVTDTDIKVCSVDPENNWQMQSDGFISRIGTSQLSGIVQDGKWYNNSFHTGGMAFMYMPEVCSKDFQIEVKYKHGISAWKRCYVGIGGTPGKTWRQKGGGIVLFTDSDGNFMLEGNSDASGEIFYARTVGTVPGYEADGIHSMKIRLVNGILTVWIDGIKTVCEDGFDYFNGGCTYFASNSENAAFKCTEYIKKLSESDVNADFATDIKDLIRIKRYLSGTLTGLTVSETIFDCNSDDKINAADIISIRKSLLS